MLQRQKIWLLICILQISSISGIDVMHDKLSIFFATQKNPKLINLSIIDVTELEHTTFFPNRRNIFLVHGPCDNIKGHFALVLIPIFLKIYDVNLFFLDWGFYAQKKYKDCRNETIVKVAKYLSQYIDSMFEEYSITGSSVGMVGFNEGGYICANAGRNLNGEIDYIIGIDTSVVPGKEAATLITKNDAQFVEVIHTFAPMDVIISGPLGHADFCVNGGMFQPPCNNDIECSHNIGYLYYAESLISNKFKGRKCNLLGYILRICCQNPSALMGGYEPDRKAKGLYFLDTNMIPPYGRN